MIFFLKSTLLLQPEKLYRDGFALLCFPGGTLPGYPGKLMNQVLPSDS
jgi:hypothetical protein